MSEHPCRNCERSRWTRVVGAIILVASLLALAWARHVDNRRDDRERMELQRQVLGYEKQIRELHRVELALVDTVYELHEAVDEVRESVFLKERLIRAMARGAGYSEDDLKAVARGERVALKPPPVLARLPFLWAFPDGQPEDEKE